MLNRRAFVRCALPALAALAFWLAFSTAPAAAARSPLPTPAVTVFDAVYTLRGKSLADERPLRMPAGAGQSCRLALQNGPTGAARLESGELALNGVQLVRSGELTAAVAALGRELTLSAPVRLEMELHGAPGSALRVTLSCADG